mmetsp:Transcript_19756/g.43662  ORF Transcript_19756/g.43662 Transcript_19756/m.43662 type:complete len:250 (+) Transcript_19756:91-840(+)
MCPGTLPGAMHRAMAVRGVGTGGMVPSDLQSAASTSQTSTLPKTRTRSFASDSQSWSPCSPPTTTTLDRAHRGKDSPGAGSFIATAWHPILPSDMSRMLFGVESPPISSSTQRPSLVLSTPGTLYTSTDEREGAPPITMILRSSRATAAAVVLGSARPVLSSDHVVVLVSNSSTLASISARPKTSSQPPTAASTCSLRTTSLEPALAVCRLAHGDHEPRSGSYTSQVPRVSIRSSFAGMPTCSAQPPTT